MASPATPATCQSEFEQAVAYALHLWPALTLAVQNNWGGSDSSDKRDWFAGAIVDLFPDISKLSPAALALLQSQSSQQQQPQNDNNEPDQIDVETVLLQVMLDEFEVAVDDDSGLLVAEQIMRARSECLKGKFDGEVAELRRRWSAKNPGEKLPFTLVEDKDNDSTDWDTDDDGEGDEDEDMEDAPALVERRERREPEVDEDGFTTVSRKKK
ncbi:Pre-rRNA-processing protein TSR2 [Naviculisporaceae sp. PSN 640]